MQLTSAVLLETHDARHAAAAEVRLTLMRRCWWNQTSDVSPTQSRWRLPFDVNTISGDVTSTIRLATQTDIATHCTLPTLYFSYYSIIGNYKTNRFIIRPIVDYPISNVFRLILMSNDQEAIQSQGNTRLFLKFLMILNSILWVMTQLEIRPSRVIFFSW